MAREGVPFLLLVGLAAYLAYRYLDLYSFAASLALFVLLVFVFRDPRRQIPASPLGVVSPVDGRIETVEKVEKGVLDREAWRVDIRISAFGTYTARCPVEGTVRNLATGSAASGDGVSATNALWVQTDEGEDVVLRFRGYRFGLAPKSFSRFGERLGQGSRCAYLRLACVAEIYLPITSQVPVEPGEHVVAGRAQIARLPHP